MLKAVYLFILLLLCAGIPRVDAATISGRVTTQSGASCQDAVVYLEAGDAELVFEESAEPVLMDQVAIEFVPHILPITVGTIVEFRNSDSVLHNVQ